jgi:cbb3-type cytochrome oxidase cytochrome c subunit
MNHDIVETRTAALGVLIAVVIAVGGLAEIVPLFFSAQVTTAAPGVTLASTVLFASHGNAGMLDSGTTSRGCVRCTRSHSSV